MVSYPLIFGEEERHRPYQANGLFDNPNRFIPADLAVFAERERMRLRETAIAAPQQISEHRIGMDAFI